MSELSMLMPPAPVETMIGVRTFRLQSPNLLKWNAVAEVFTRMGSVLPLVQVLASFQKSDQSPIERMSEAVEKLLKCGLGDALHCAARELLMTKANLELYLTELSEDERKAVRASNQKHEGRWLRNEMFAEFIDDNLSALQALHTIATSAQMTQAKDALGKLLPFLQPVAGVASSQPTE